MKPILVVLVMAAILSHFGPVHITPLGTGPIASGTCAPAIKALPPVIGNRKFLVVLHTFTTDPTEALGQLSIYSWLSGKNYGYFYIKVCNATLTDIRPKAISLQWQVVTIKTQ